MEKNGFKVNFFKKRFSFFLTNYFERSDSLKELADQAWNNTEGVGVKFITNVLEEIVPSLAFIPSFGNVIGLFIFKRK